MINQNKTWLYLKHIYNKQSQLIIAFVVFKMADDGENSVDNRPADESKPEKMFTLKKWNAVAMWSWDVECDICAICRVQVMGKLLAKMCSASSI